MTDRARSKLAWTLGAGGVAVIVGAFARFVITEPEIADKFDSVWILAWLGFPVAGAVLAAHRPRTRIGWLMLAIGLLIAIGSLTDPLIRGAAVGRGPLSLPTAALVAALSPWVLAFGLIPFVLMLFPEDRIGSPRMRAVARVGVALLVLSELVWIIRPTQQLDAETVVDSPIGLSLPFIDQAVEVSGTLLGMIALIAVVNLILRFRRSSGDRRQQMKWFAYASLVLPVAFLVGTPLEEVSILLSNVIFLIGFVVGLNGLAAAIVIAVLKYRLYDIDVVISKTVVFAGLAAFITGIYVAIVVGIGTLIGSGGEPNLALSIVATALVAVAFQPVRERLTKIANRLIYGKRATPYEVLSRFSSHLGETVASDETLEQMVRLLADGTGAAGAQVWLKAGGQMRTAASWPTDAAPDFVPVVNTDGSLPEFAEVDLAVPICHQGQLLGALTITKKRGETITPTEQKLVEQLAAQAGLVLKNVQLTADLLARLEELRDSRRRLVAAQDEERRRLERDLHDGAQQQLVALKIKLGIAKTLAEREQATKTADVIDAVSADADDAVQTLRELAHGIYPPLLAAEGLAVALAGQARKPAIPVTVTADGIGRYPQEVEAAVYFCVLEALNNVAKYANATNVTVTLAQTNGDLSFTVVDDGVGFDPATTPRGHGLTNMGDRLHALDGGVSITSEPEKGTQVVGLVPVETKVAP